MLSVIAKFIRDLSTVVGAVTAVSVFFLQVFPQTAIGALASDFAASVFGLSSQAEGFVYYEMNDEGIETSDGQLVLFPEMKRVATSDISDGQLLVALSSVRLRSSDEASNRENIIAVYGAEQCFEVLSQARLLEPIELKEASNAGWFEVRLSECNS